MHCTPFLINLIGLHLDGLKADGAEDGPDYHVAHTSTEQIGPTMDPSQAMFQGKKSSFGLERHVSRIFGAILSSPRMPLNSDSLEAILDLMKQ